MMPSALTSRRQAVLCALGLLVCALATHPVAEIGMDDDWSYVETARILAQTGHIAYVGWAGAMLGWQLFLGALFARLFGPSFTAIRASTLFVALLTAFLTHRCMVRAGLSLRNATFGTLSLVLSPLFLPLALSFMTDTNALFCVVLCLYACLRAMQAKTDRAVLAWLAFAALSNALDGTVRQLAWLGVLVIFPCAIWLLRRRPHVLVSGGLLYLISSVFIISSLHWFSHQPYTTPESPFAIHVTLRNLNRLINQSSSLSLGFVLFLLPVLAAFIPAFSFRNRRSKVFVACGAGLFLAALICVFFFNPHSLGSFLAPFQGSSVTIFGLGAVTSIPGGHSAPVILPLTLRVVLTIAVLFALLCFLDFLRTRRLNLTDRSQSALPPPISWRDLLVLLVPFVLAYLALLISCGLQRDLFDRYLLLILLIGLIFLLRLFQDSVQPNLPRACYGLLLLYALYAVASEHDTFCSLRARVTAIDELRAAGIPDTAIDGGWEHNAMVQVERCGHINYPHIRMDSKAPLKQSSSLPGSCEEPENNPIPILLPLFAVSFDPHFGGGLAPFPPIPYRIWLGPQTVTLYIVNIAKLAAIQH